MARARFSISTISPPSRTTAGDLERGQGVYIVLYRGDTPSELLFAGYSFD